MSDGGRFPFNRRRLLITGAVAAAALALSCSASGSPVPPAAGKAVWTATKRGTYDRGWLVVSDLSGGDRRALTRPLGGAERRWDHYPAWSPDGSLIAFLRWTPRRTALMVIRSDGSGLHQVAEVRRADSNAINDPINDFRWSPDGSHLAYLASFRLWSSRIYVVGVDGSGGRLIAKLPKKPFGYLSLFDWTPDGRVTYSFTVGEPISFHYTGPSHLKTASADGSLTANVVTEDAITDVSWTPSGSLFYVRHCAMTPCQLALRGPASGRSRPLTHFKPWLGDDEWDDLPLMRRPESSDLVYTHDRSIYEFSPTANRTRNVLTLACLVRYCWPNQDEVFIAAITKDGRYALIEYEHWFRDGSGSLTRDYRLDLDTGAFDRIHLAPAEPEAIYQP